MPKRKLIATWIGTAIAKESRSSRDSTAVTPSTSSSHTAPTNAMQRAMPSCSAAARARPSGSIVFNAAPGRFCTCWERRRSGCGLPLAPLDCDEEGRIDHGPAGDYSELACWLHRTRRHRARASREHQSVRGKREAPARPAGEHQSLVVMRAVRTPEFLAVDRAPRERGGSVGDERGERDDGQCDGPGAYE